MQGNKLQEMRISCSLFLFQALELCWLFWATLKDVLYLMVLDVRKVPYLDLRYILN